MYTAAIPQIPPGSSPIIQGGPNAFAKSSDRPAKYGLLYRPVLPIYGQLGDPRRARPLGRALDFPFTEGLGIPVR